MIYEYPSYIVKSIFYKVVKDSEEVKTSSVFLHRGKCPICNDYKKRMYIKQYPDKHYHIYCHNCGYSTNFYTFIKKNFNEYLNELQNYHITLLKNENNDTKEVKNNNEDHNDDKLKKIITDIKLTSYLKEHSFLLSEKQENNSKKEFVRQYAINYLTSRKIQENYWKDFVFFYSGPMKGYIGIPMWDENHILLHIQGRILLKSKNKNFEQPKYIFLKDSDKGIENIPKPIYGLWRVNKNKTCYISEGTLSCLAFGDQGLSTCGANISLSFLNKVNKMFPNIVWSFDNYWIDNTARKKINFLLENDQKCFIIPKNLPCKDTNDLLLYFQNWNVIPQDFIENNIYEGKTGLLKLKLLF